MSKEILEIKEFPLNKHGLKNGSILVVAKDTREIGGGF